MSVECDADSDARACIRKGRKIMDDMGGRDAKGGGGTAKGARSPGEIITGAVRWHSGFEGRVTKNSKHSLQVNEVSSPTGKDKCSMEQLAM